MSKQMCLPSRKYPMKNRTPILFLLLLVFSCYSQPLFAQSDHEGSQPEVLSPGEADQLAYLREFEWMAADVYQYFLALHPLPLFQNIGMNALNNSEMAHLLLMRNNLTDPARPHIPGKYMDTTLISRYNRLIGKGKLSQDDALLACLSLEEFALQKVMLFKLKATHPEMATLLEMLARSSRNHLRSLWRRCSDHSLLYEPTRLSREYFQTVVNQPHERGRGPVPPPEQP